MLKTFSAALIAASMLTAPVFAAGTTATTNTTVAPMTAPAPAPKAAINAKAGIDNKAGLNAKAAVDTKATVAPKATVKSGKKLHKKHLKMTRHHASKAVQHVRHVKVIKHKKMSNKVAVKLPSAKKSTVRSGS
jgi:hypothetical protein